MAWALKYGFELAAINSAVLACVLWVWSSLEMRRSSWPLDRLGVLASNVERMARLNSYAASAALLSAALQVAAIVMTVRD